MVEFKNNDKSCDIHTWGEFCEIIKGNGVQKADFVEEGFGCIHYGQIYTHYGPYTYSTNKFVSKATFDKARKASKGDVIMTDTSENVEDICKSVAYLGEDDIAVSNHALILKHNQNPKFLSYSTLTDCFLAQKRKVVVGVKVSGIKPEQLAKFKIYLPSLTEQQRIVGILDTFTSSIENLKEQIAQRRKQYEYYRDQLLDLEGKDGVEMRGLGDVCQINAGGDVPKDSFSDCKTEHYCIPIISNGVGEKAFYGYTDLAKISIPSVTIAARGTIGYAEYRDYPYYPIVRLISVTPLLDNVLNAKFLYYKLIKQNYSVSTSGIPQLTIPMVKRIIIPVPPLSEQQRIVSILDTFEASIRNLEQQLALREKQYEYYRNKLLTFE